MYMEEAIMSETPVPFPECMRMRMTVRTAESARMTRRMVFRTPTKCSFLCAHGWCNYIDWLAYHMSQGRYQLP